MKCLILGGLSLFLILTATVPAVRAEHIAVSPTALGRPLASQSQVTPFNLVFLAYRGYFKDQGIPSYGRLISDYQFGRIDSSSLVQAGIKAGFVSQSALSDRGYLNAVRVNIRSLGRRSGR